MKNLTMFVIRDIIKNKIVLMYTILLSIFAFSILNLEDTAIKSILSLLNLLLLIVPLVSLIFSTIYLYNSSEFIELLVSQPIRRSQVWLSLFIGLTISLNLAFIISVGIPVLLYIRDISGFFLILSGFFMTTIFTSLAMLTSIFMKDKARGIGMAIMVWLFMTLIYDGLILFFMFQFSDYPIEKFMVGLSASNPIDMARIMVILQVDMAALMGYTGAVFKKLFGSDVGIVFSTGIMLCWIFLPLFISLKMFLKKDL